MFSWLYNFPRLVGRWEYRAESYLDLLQPACAVIPEGRLCLDAKAKPAVENHYRPGVFVAWFFVS